MDELTELVKAIRNRCDMYMILHGIEIARHLLPTLLEDMYQDAQFIIDRHCTEKDDEPQST